MQDRYFITGATGFIGANLTHELVKRGHDVRILTREKKIPWRLSDIYSKLTVYHGGLLDKGLERIIDAARPTVIFHFAAYGVNPWETEVEEMIQTNITGTFRLLQALKRHPFRLFVYTGTSSEYGVKHAPMREKDILEPVNDYSVTKAAATLLVTKIAKRDHLPMITLRPFSPYGYYEHPKRLFPSVVMSALSGDPIRVSAPTHVRDFLFIDDLIAVYIKATQKKSPPGEIYNIGSGHEHTVRDVVENVIAISKSSSRVEWGAVAGQSRQIEPERWQSDSRKVSEYFGWKPKISWTEGIQKTLTWFSTHRELYE